MADFEGIKPRQHKRSYIQRLEADPRLHAMFTGWVAQAVREAEVLPGAYGLPSCFAEKAAGLALELALSHILNNDGEYQALLEQLERTTKAHLDTLNLIAMPLAIPVAQTISALSDPDTFTAGVKAGLEAAEQRCRYVAKHNSDRQEEGEYRDGFEIACEVCSQAIGGIDPAKITAQALPESRG
ncbi:hypothetical protein [Novosphingobium sp.]|uniref:hypothetical protein n=1 Tax=Novosphingobium sp. TaxID=1874826 RepID=UPI0031D2EB3C